ncbi:acetyltransferase [Bacillus sp. JJ1521]|uniref:acetyltransferase n=1 Tax=Bacillus sp. JJ1521 TaxID=3122957 RepID=UPI002FFECF49
MNIAVIGKGGHSKVIEELIKNDKENNIVGFFDDKYLDFTIENNIYYGPILSATKMIEFFCDVKFVIAIGNNRIRKRIFDDLDIPDYYYTTLVHQSAVISKSAKIGTGTVIFANAVVNADAKIGSHSIINSSSMIEHDNNIGDFVHISPNATLTGSVEIEDGVHIGAGATIIPNVKVEKWSVIGAGATVISNIPSNSTAVGVPAVVKSKKVIGGV